MPTVVLETAQFVNGIIVEYQFSIGPSPCFAKDAGLTISALFIFRTLKGRREC